MSLPPFPRDVLAGLDWSKLLHPEEVHSEANALRDLHARAEAALVPFTPITPEERFAIFGKYNYRPHGLFLPNDDTARAYYKQRLEAIGNLPTVDQRFSGYHALQNETEHYALIHGADSGSWTGQQAIARSTARFRIAAFGRRGGKTMHGAHEGLGFADTRPRSTVWFAAPTMRLVSRAFDRALELIVDYRIPVKSVRNGAQEKLIILENESRIEGISLDNVGTQAGAAVDFLLLDEAAQVNPDAWYRACLPPLADRNGHALLISSWEGEGDFFHTKAMEAKKEMAERGVDADWEFFQAASYDVNFYAFPKGRQTEFLVQAQKEMPWQDFLEQFGAIPSSEKDRVYPEFKERVHLGSYPFDPDQPVRLAVDPSGGTNAYAVAVLQDYESYLIQIDEIYETHTTCEEIFPMIFSRPWYANVEEVVMDSALPAEIERWLKAGFRAFGVADKPKVRERLPFHRNLLRDPLRFRALYRRKMNELLVEIGREPDSDYDLEQEQQKALIIQIEQSLSDEHISDFDLAELRACNRLYVDRRCHNTVWEYKNYRAPKRKIANRNYTEDPADYANHIMDALGYYVWQYHRFGHAAGGRVESYIETAHGSLPVIPVPNERDEDEPMVPENVQRMRLYLRELRGNYAPPDSKVRSTLQPCR